MIVGKKEKKRQEKVMWLPTMALEVIKLDGEPTGEKFNPPYTTVNMNIKKKLSNF